MTDFASSLYLGLGHPMASLAPWSRLTTGKPMVLATPPLAAAIARAFADLQGCEAATLLPSTLHLFFDLFEVLRHDGIRLYIDAGAYPIAGWAAQRAAALGVPVRRLPHFDAEAARAAIAAEGNSRLRPVIVADGFCPGCGRAAPLRGYLRQVASRDGYIVLDDTQALGVWGTRPTPDEPYGKGGGGSVRRHALHSPHVILGSSLAKGFGVPLAVLSGDASLIRRFERRSETRVHTSPPSAAVLSAAARALVVNTRYGDALRRRLARNVIHFRNGIRGLALSSRPTLFPVQRLVPYGDPKRLQQYLATRGIEAIVVRGCDARDGLVLVLNARHTRRDIDRAAAVLSRRAGGKGGCRSDLCAAADRQNSRPESVVGHTFELRLD
jgi:8-amino-7-oxononanoate synthase